MNRSASIMALSIIIGIIALTTIAAGDDSPMIVGGEEVEIEGYPYACSLRRWTMHICGAALLKPHFALTAAHCVYSKLYSIDDYALNVGSGEVYGSGSSHALASILIHADYERRSFQNDVALLKLVSGVVLGETTAPVPLPPPDFHMQDDDLGIVVGWGYTQEGGPVSMKLKMAEIPILKNSICFERYAGYRNVTEKNICAAYEQGQVDACQGDSGGPLTVRGMLLGVVSWGRGCARPQYPGVYANVHYFMPWILERIQ